MAKKKVYAVRKGKVTGIFDTWNACKEAVDGYSGAVYKSFQSLEEAQRFLEVEKAEKAEKTYEESNTKKPIRISENENDKVLAYVDGSYSDDLKRYSYGMLLILPNGEKIEDFGYRDDQQALVSRNVAGELLGTMMAVKKVKELGYRDIEIFHDYEGIAKWYIGDWKAKSYVAINYLEFMSKYKDEIKISFQWVKGHSGDPNNETVDKLAKQALGIGEKPRVGDNYIVVEPIKMDNLEIILDLLKEDFENIAIKKTEIADTVNWQIVFEKERLVVVYYTSKRKLMIQGKQERLFNVLSAYVLELVESDQIFDVFNPFYNIEVNKEFVETEFITYLPNKRMEFSPKLNNSLKQSIYNLHLEGDMYDHTHLSFPALRALEGFLKLILRKHNIVCDRSFNVFVKKDKTSRTYKLDEKYNVNIGSPNKIRYINSVYDYYNKHRNTLFHWDYYENPNNDTTRILDKNHWKLMITDTLKLIDGYFITN
ncbi:MULTISPECIES: viroplasmin family protein [unclassified Bacillus (in: firmicutes)]|uniref:ribonuclease H1 domain-containing protein n=1 Tax=unclassified Bacillus (in: firmicutes) TaxID=185979 RepID=UPI001BE70117|nr:MULTISPECIES: viroplasmin family protein [unclassified Bacillus (in: firmicutes)]MBT2615139.1 type II toxin-antitoxin system RnlA family toxin [Bacillus sp. ISL-78]MBT2628248.1 type II toxin-antitoxin system RnlA family toxin [Bacillus sp. ISL-101]